MKQIYLFFFFCIICALSFSNEITWQPINPAFGGNSYNSSWLRSSADAQNGHEEKNKGSSYQKKDPVAQFQENLDRLILNKLANRIMDAIYEGEQIDTGQFEMGNYLINIADDGSFVTVSISDLITGNETFIEVPNK